MRFISLFSGIGGFDLGFDRAGMECAAQVEFDEQASAVLARHWPDVPRFKDVRGVGKHNLPTVELICGGFPCQDVSVAGKRAGLAGERSGLWFEFHRILDELKPEWVVIENVPGLLSSQGGRDFAVILQGLVELRYGVAWRVLDAQYAGVAQRRRRVFIVGHLGDGRAAEVLFERDGSHWDTPPRRAPGQVATQALAGRLGSGGPDDNKAQGHFYVPVPNGAADADALERPSAFGGNRTTGELEVSTALSTKMNRFDFESDTFVAFMAGNGGKARSVSASDETAPTLKGAASGNNMVPTVAFEWQNGDKASMGVLNECSPTLKTSTTPAISRASWTGVPDVSPALTSEGHDGSEDGRVRHAFAITERTRADGRNLETQEELAYALTNPGSGGRTHSRMIATFDERNVTSPQNRTSVEPDKPANTLYSEALSVITVDTLQHKGYNTPIDEQGEHDASTQETDTGALLRILRQKAGEEAFAEWQSGILDSLQQAQVLRPRVHGKGVRRAPREVRSQLGDGALPRAEDSRPWPMRAVWIARCVRRASQRWQLAEQQQRQLRAYLSQLSQSGPQQAQALRDMWQTSEGLGVLREALSAFQEVRRPVDDQEKPAYAAYTVRRLTPVEAERLQAFPDGWTDNGQSDSARYRQLGNAVCVSVAEWIGQRIMALEGKAR
jgi:DNA (cytosine-5)-methyltransferase 1